MQTLAQLASILQECTEDTGTTSLRSPRYNKKDKYLGLFSAMAKKSRAILKVSVSSIKTHGCTKITSNSRELFVLMKIRLFKC